MTKPINQDEKYGAAKRNLKAWKSPVNTESPKLTTAEFQSYLSPPDQVVVRRYTREEAMSRPFRVITADDTAPPLEIEPKKPSFP